MRQATPASTTAGSELLALQRLVGNQAVSALVASRRIQRETDGDGGQSGAAIRNTAVFPASLNVIGALASIGQTSISGSVVAASLSSSGTVDVGGNVVMGPLRAERIVAPIVVLKGVKTKGGSAAAQDRAGGPSGDADVGRAFSDDEQTRTPTPAGSVSAGGGISAGEAAQAAAGAGATASAGVAQQPVDAGVGFSEGEAPQATSGADADSQAPQADQSFSALVVRESLTVGGNMAVGFARLGPSTSIGGSLSVSGSSRVQTVQAGGTIVIRGGEMDPGTDIDAAVIQNTD